MYGKYRRKLVSNYFFKNLIFTFTRFNNLGRDFQTQLHQEALQVIEEE
jgi:hypothetical protein